jgi:hypothetical protein
VNSNGLNRRVYARVAKTFLKPGILSANNGVPVKQAKIFEFYCHLSTRLLTQIDL